MKNTFRYGFLDHRGRFQQAGLGLVSFFPCHGGLNLLDERFDRVDGGSIPLMSSFGLPSTSNRGFVSLRHRLLL